MLVHLHTHSSYSFLEGMASPQDLAVAAARYGMPALGLTDHGRLSGAIDFYKACSDSGVKPILGIELDVRFPDSFLADPSNSIGPLVLLAQNIEGWSGLCRLASAAQADVQGETALPIHFLEQNSAGLICLTGGERSLVDALAGRESGDALISLLSLLKEIFPGRIYVELQYHSPAGLGRVELLNRTAQKIGLPAAASHGIYYQELGQASLQRTISAIRLNRPIRQLNEADTAPPNANFLSPAELSEHFSAYPEALDNTLEIADRCNVVLPLGVPRFPQVDLPDGTDPIQVLRQKAQQGLIRRFDADPAVQSRLDHELDVIQKCGYEALFLVMEDIVGFARENGIPIASRGSASSSLVAHCLGITTPNPVRLNLYFERFLNPARRTLPDIDTDLCSRRRDEVIQFVYKRFGFERVAMVCTVNRFRRRSALREVAKAHGLPPARVSELVNSLPQRWYGTPDRTTREGSPYAVLEDSLRSSVEKIVLAQASSLIGMPRHLSIHPGGVVIAPGPMTDLAATQMAAKGILITQLDLESIEGLGLVKIDLLGIRGLTVLGDVANAIASVDFGAEDLPPRASVPASQFGSVAVQIAREGMRHLDEIPDNDPETAETTEHGRTIGCFQIESPGMRATLKEVHARSADDLMAALALYRPGPLTGGLKDAFIARIRGQDSATYLHPSLIPLLGDTFGVILYQEQVLRIANELAGFSLAEADLLRRGMSHFDPGKQMSALQQSFVDRAAERKGVPPEIGEKIWKQMAAFAGYGFPKAHAASYARVAWQSAWCKTHYPALFMAAVLANWGGYYGQGVYLTEARRLGLVLRPPNVNYAGDEFSVHYLENKPVLFMGMNQVHELTFRTRGRIQIGRPYASLQDFLVRVDPRPIEAENLIRAGCLDEFGNIPNMLRQLKQGGWRRGQLSLFEREDSEEEDWQLDEKAAAQEAILGISLIAHPLELFAENIARANALSTLDAAARVGSRVRVAGARQTWRRHRLANGELLYFMALEDLEGMLDVMIPGEVYRRYREALSGTGPYIIEGIVEWDPDRGEPIIRAERAWGTADFHR